MSIVGFRQVDPPARVLQHPLDEFAHLAVGEDDRRQLRDAVACDEDPRQRVDPELSVFCRLTTKAGDIPGISRKSPADIGG